MHHLLVVAAAVAVMSQEAPDQSALRSLGEVAIKNQLLDPYSAVIGWSPGPLVEVNGVSKGLGIFKRHVVIGSALVGCGTVNAKNRMGGYIGQQWFDVVIQNGAVVQVEIDSPDDPSPLTEQFCRSLGFGTPMAGGTAPAAMTPSAPTSGEGTVSPELGVEISTLTPAMAAVLGRPDLACAVVSGVEPGSTAERAGLRKGDCITTFGGMPVHSEYDLLAAVQAAQPEKLLKVELLRAGAPLSLTAKIGSANPTRPAVAASASPVGAPQGAPPLAAGGPVDAPKLFGATFQDRPGVLRALSPCPGTKGAFFAQVCSWWSRRS